MDYDKPELTKKEEKYRKKLQALIKYCLYCQPYDEGDVVWIYGDRTELFDLLYECNIPEQFWGKVIGNLRCPFCGNDSFDIGIDVGLETKFEKELEEHMDEVYALYGSDVRALESLLESFPFLAYQNKLAKRIYREIKNRQLPLSSVQGNFYRARKVESSEVFNSKNMYNPPIGKPSEGRFNHAGQSHLYLSNDKTTALKEVTSNEHSLLVWCQQFKVTQPVNDILDLSFDWDKLTPSTSTLLLSLKVFNTIERNDRNKENWKPDYYLTRFIMDCAKSAGYEGIKYNSTKNINSFDIVLFYTDKIKIEPIGNPTIEIFLNKVEQEKLSTDLLDF